MGTQSGESLAAQPSHDDGSLSCRHKESVTLRCSRIDRLGSHLVSDRTSSLYTIRLTNPATYSLRNGALFNPETPRTTEPDQPKDILSCTLPCVQLRLSADHGVSVIAAPQSESKPPGAYKTPFLSLSSQAILCKNGAAAGYARDVNIEAAVLA
jgi:hypothetical protein